MSEHKLDEHHEQGAPEAAAAGTKEPPQAASPKSPVSPDFDHSDKEDDTFEDAVDTKSIRSLTTRKLSMPPPPVEKSETDSNTKEADLQSLASPTIPEEPHEPLHQETDKPANGHVHETHQDEDVAEDHELHKKPSHRLSQASEQSLDNVNLDDDAATASTPGGAQKDKSTADSTSPPKTISLSSITSALPAMPWSPPAADAPSKNSSGTAVNSTSAEKASAPAPAPAAPAPIGRKLTSPFSWLSRSSSKEPKEAASPPILSPRRNTASSIATLMSNPEMMLSRLEEEKEVDANGGRNPSRNNLKDRFKQLRLREETGNAIVSGDAKFGTPGLGVTSPTGTVHSTVTLEDREATSNLAVQQPPLSPLPPSPNPSLAPGTASGVTAGPSAISDTPVDWDLWQSVVYEGPSAVARTSPEELNKAIATGIPSAIRGVIWQVLAQSKNEDLEVVYRELVVRGTDKEKKRQSNSSANSNSLGISTATSSEKPASSASSIRSEQSAASGSGANTSGNGSPSLPEKDAEKDAKDADPAVVKAMAAAAAERKKREKDDLVAIQKLEKVIKRDLGTRTSYSKFAAAQGLQDGLFGVCKAYALFDEGVGYAQGMNFLVMPLLFNMPEDEAFCLLVRLMNHYHLRDLFIQDMPGLHMHLYQFERLLEDFEPALYCHLHRRGISPHLYATQWFLTLFAYRFPLQLVLRIYDLILSEGLSAILKFGIVLMQKNATQLLGMSDMAQLTTFLKDRVFDVYIDSAPSSTSILENGFFGSSSSSMDKEVYRADQLVHDACEVKITPEILKAYRAEWEEKTRAEKERETELNDLKTANISYAIKVRKLEERIEAVDHEQAALATELVHTKVENEELRDENESLKGQVKELRNVIEQQPAEIEQKWQLERDDLMKRNEKVHEENQRLEKELADLEEQLVRTKMQFAEINSQHENLTRKWTDLKKQFA